MVPQFGENVWTGDGICISYPLGVLEKWTFLKWVITLQLDPKTTQAVMCPTLHAQA